MLEADEGNDGLGEAGQQHRADEGPGDGAGEGEVVVGGGQPVVDVRGGRAVDEHIVDGLDVERLLDLGVGGDDEVEQHEGRDGEREEGVCPLLVTVCMANLDFPFFSVCLFSLLFLFFLSFFLLARRLTQENRCRRCAGCARLRFLGGRHDRVTVSQCQLKASMNEATQ